MTEVVLVASKNIVSIDQKTHELVVSKKAIEVIISTIPPKSSAVMLGLKVEFITLTTANVDAKRVYQSIVRVGGLLVDIVGGTTQQEILDYITGDNFIDWNGRGLDGLLSAGDVIRLAYVARE